MWLPVDDGEAAALKVWRETGVRVLPGAYLAAMSTGRTRAGYIRVAMVAPKERNARGCKPSVTVFIRNKTRRGNNGIPDTWTRSASGQQHAEAIEKRGKELIGISLIVLGLLCAAMVGSYTPDDPNWLVSTDAQVQNWLGRSGASIAAPLMMVVGLGAWAIAIVLMVWGLRFVLHWGTERALGRLIFAPIGIALLAIYAETLQPGAAWSQTHSFGLGGMFGDTVMGFMLTVLPIGSAFALKLMRFDHGGCGDRDERVCVGLYTLRTAARLAGFCCWAS